MSRTLFLLLAVFPTIVVAQTRAEKVRDDRKQVEADGFWIYNDLPKAFVTASKSGKPLVVVFRCIPCEECVKLDDDLVDQDPVIRSLLEQFVCARQVSTNGLDLGTFQYDTDQSFAVFLLNADGTIYGRFGTRSHRSEWLGDVSLAGLAKALEGALELHRDYPANRSSLMGKRGQPMEVPSPEKYPSLEGKYTASLDFGDSVVKSCIHCHQIGDAQREWYRAARKPIPEKVLFPYPHPKTIGLTMDPKERATILDVAGGSAADKADLRPGDRMERFNGEMSSSSSMGKPISSPKGRS
jgi:serine protease Do